MFDSYLTMYVGQGKPGQLAPGQFERIAKALSDPRRFAVLETIAAAEQECAHPESRIESTHQDGACCFQKLCNEFPVSKATISHHLKELVQAGLVDSERAGQFVHTRIRPGAIEAYAAELVRRAGGTE